ncbi:MAG: GT-D fold domain-containing glycosyltransferase [Eubacteriales bacterium]|nr:GT-D fold domain-containing glycosyltransferase [Eubacteriales bacterium]
MLPIRNYLHNLGENIKYILKNNMFDLDYQKMQEVYEIFEWNKKRENGSFDNVIKVLSPIDSIDYIKKSNKSFIRFGDGEIKLINGKDLSFQKYETKLSSILKEVISNYQQNVLIGINYMVFHDMDIIDDRTKAINFAHSQKIGMSYLKLCNKQNIYIDAAFGLLPAQSSLDNYDNFFEKLKQLFFNKDIILFIGENVKQYKHNIFEYAKSFTVEYGPTTNAFSQYDEILERVKKYAKSPMGGGQQIFCFILGPTGKALVYELSKLNYLAYDIGHMWKAYYFYKENLDYTKDNFFKPD